MKNIYRWRGEVMLDTGHWMLEKEVAPGRRSHCNGGGVGTLLFYL
jgi:hypothetical protein